VISRESVQHRKTKHFPAKLRKTLTAFITRIHTPKKPGRYTLLARAKGADGSDQLDKHDQNYSSYVINYPLPIEVFVESPSGASA
jgi:hypothetical protein